MTACTSPRLRPSETPLRISRPSTVTCRSLISKSANVPPVRVRVRVRAGEASLLWDLVGAGGVAFGEPGRSRDRRPQQSFVNLLLVPAGLAASRRHVLDGAVALKQLKHPLWAFDPPGHVALSPCRSG